VKVYKISIKRDSTYELLGKLCRRQSVAVNAQRSAGKDKMENATHIHPRLQRDSNPGP